MAALDSAMGGILHEFVYFENYTGALVSSVSAQSADGFSVCDAGMSSAEAKPCGAPFAAMHRASRK